MKILAIIGSPRANGNTYKTIKRIEERISQKDPSVEFEYLQLSKTELTPCKGCYVCIERGEGCCPLKDERENIELKIKQAVAVIFASPVYTYNVSWIMKNMLDRFAYRCHRPDFHGKKAMVVITTGAVGLGFVQFILSFMIGTMGFVTCAKAGLTYAPAHEKNPKKTAKETSRLNKQADLFYNKIKDNTIKKPTFIKMLTFRMQQKAFANAPANSADYKFWNEKGWLANEESYYYPVNGVNFNKTLALLLSKLMT